MSMVHEFRVNFVCWQACSEYPLSVTIDCESGFIFCPLLSSNFLKKGLTQSVSMLIAHFINYDQLRTVDEG